MAVYQELLHIIGTVLIHIAAVIGVGSVWVHSRVYWQESPMGRHLMAYMSVIALVLVLSCIVNDLGDSWWFQLIRLIAFVGVPIVMAQRLALQIKAQRTPPSQVEDQERAT